MVSKSSFFIFAYTRHGLSLVKGVVADDNKILSASLDSNQNDTSRKKRY